MSYRVTYKVEGIKLPLEPFQRLKPSEETKQMIRELESIHEDQITLKQYRELQELRSSAQNTKIDYNGCTIATMNSSGPADIYYNPIYKTASIPGHEGSDLTFKEEDEFLVLKDGYFDDNYDANLELVEKVCQAFKQTCTIDLIADEANSGERYTIKYINGERQ